MTAYAEDIELEPAPEYDTTTMLGYDLQRLAELKASIDALEAERKSLSEQVIKQLEAEGHRSVTLVPDSGQRMRATVNRSATKEVNLVKLREMDEDLYEYVTKRVVDSTALDHAINTHKFTEAALHTISIKQRSPYIRFSLINEHEDFND